MKNIILVFLMTISGLVTPAALAQDSYAFTDVTVIMMESGETRPHQTVLISNDRIEAVGPASDVTLPASATVIDGAGRYLMPGLTEMHGHIPGTSSSWPAEDVLFLYVSQGVTTVRGMLGSEGQLELRDKAARGEIIAPTLYLAAPALGGMNVDGPDDARAKVTQYAREGWDLLKVHEGLSLEEYDAIADVANEIGLPFGGHIAEDVGLLHALEKGQRTVEHMDNYLTYIGADETPVTEQQLQKAVEVTLAAGTGIVPTLALFEQYGTEPDVLAAYAELRYTPHGITENWAENRVNQYEQNSDELPEIALFLENQRKLLKAFSEGGVEVLLGSDAPQVYSVPGFSLHREMTSMENAGMERSAILYSGTVSAGAYFADKDSFGVIKPGARADLVLLDANPFEAIGNMREIKGVMVRGQWVSKDFIDQKLGEIEKAYKN
ncbi:amidohydrolase family protein [Hyphococcus flavus]|uniref:Amidohydrolase family protein n=1 Tax=Hyphococcus flavus TaxID=1866326 RepID=A0AAF0CFZ5_9PROT|nr:amidohydrolase family protein [Hyphococcus flavus]WDI31844.1 amidohydrolase family protein [Hyphococcus flavus]